MTTAARLFPLLLALAAGCGLEQYQKRADEDRARLKAVDEENKYLGDPLTAPTNATEPDPAKQPALRRVEFFLRPPKGIQIVAADEPPARSGSGSTELYRYPGEDGYAVLLAADAGELSAERFQSAVRGALGEYWKKATGRELPEVPAQGTREKRQLAEFRGRKPAPVEFEMTVIKNAVATNRPYSYHIYFHQGEDKKQLAVIYQVPRDVDSAQFLQAIEHSLKTAALGKAAQENLRAYQERRIPFLLKK